MPTIIEEPNATDRSQDRQSTFARRLVISILRVAIVLVIAAAIGSGWYLARKGFGHQWRARIVEELHRRGVEASIGHLTLNPFRGLVARNVRIFSYQDRTHTLAFISEIVLDINYAAFFHHQAFLNALDVRNAEVTLSLKGPQGKTDRAHPRHRSIDQARGLSAIAAVVGRRTAKAIVDPAPDCGGAAAI